MRLTENGKVKRAAVVLFGKDPSQFYPNMAVKIGRFALSHDDLKFLEAEEGNLAKLLHNIPDILNKKFFVKSVDFEGLQRIEKGEYPVAALREMLLNGLVHRDYLGSMIQIRMHDNQFSIWNEGPLPQGLSLESLKRQRQLRIVQYVFDEGNVTNAIVQQLNNVGKSAATVDLQELVEKGVLNPSSAKGRGRKYTLKRLK